LDEISELEQDILGTAVQQQQHASIADVGISVSSEKANGAEDHVADRVVLDGKVLTSADVQLMKKKIDDLILVTETKEKRLEEVRGIVATRIGSLCFTILYLTLFSIVACERKSRQGQNNQ
jgi:hypothetical protein